MKVTKSQLLIIILVCLLLLFPIVFMLTNKKSRENYETQPLVYIRQKSTVPDACRPYMGCTWPSESGNPVVYRGSKGHRLPAKNADKVWCTDASRDCHLYQDCVDGNCVPKQNLNNYKIEIGEYA